ncbi:CoA-binding protein [Nocardioides sp. LHG3406-4]|uniref:CoA-binding protein n=1 Tax=Nocardioides sp. LHG3406-4 TaxID=2804575 RepID=UPI003CE9D513
MSNLKSFLDPQSVAVVGASKDRRKPGNLILRNIMEGGYAGTIYPVNPGGGEIEGLTAYTSVAEVPTKINLVVIVLGRAHVEEALRQCIEVGASSVVIVTAGFGEGDEMGKAAQVRFKEMVADSGIIAIGPNTIGYINKEVDLFASFVNFPSWDDGPVALVAMTGIYSGAVVHELMSDPSQRFGIRLSIDIGNRIGLSELDLLEELATRADIEVLGFYIEEFDDARAFLARAAEVKREKPIVLLKPGRTEEGAQAALSHTGSLASDDAILDQLLQQHGIIRADDNEEFVSLLRTFSYCPTPAGRRVGIITYSGALGITATDAVVQAGLSLAELSPETSEKLNELAPDWQHVRNPADLWSAAEADPGRAARLCFGAMLADPSVDQLLFVLLALPNVDFEGMREVFADLRQQRPEIPIHVTLHGGLRGEWASRLEGLGIVVHDSARSAARAMAALATYTETRELLPSAHAHRVDPKAAPAAE